MDRKRHSPSKTTTLSKAFIMTTFGTDTIQNHIHLQAINPDTNTFRDYEITLTPGLLNHWVVLIAYGRIGTKGQQKTYAFETIAKAQHFIQKCLKKRMNAKKRIGCEYKLFI